MKIQPTSPTISFLMRFKNKDLGYFEQHDLFKHNVHPSFKEVLQERMCQPLGPTFVGQWPIPNKVPQDGGVLSNPQPKEGTGEKLNFIA